MLFNSFAFAVFLPIVLILYWRLPHRAQNIMLLIASYVFYGYWDWRFLSLIAISTGVDYMAGLRIFHERFQEGAGAKKRKKRWLIASICTNLGILGFFKYYNFFAGSMADLLTVFGAQPDMLYLNIILPVGISFYTFQTMSYTIDIYRGHMHPTKRFFDFALYVAFFPQLVAGPIERAKALLPRILRPREFGKAQFLEGAHLIFYGLFKKVFVADNLAPLVDTYYSTPDPTGFQVVVSTWAFYVQVYCDFSGYSDIARGCAKCMGIELMRNFDFPLVSINPVDRWRRWHISLSSWLRDYLYIPLGGSRVSPGRVYVNLIATMLLGGLWHGAAWCYVIWGAWEAVILAGHRAVKPLLELAPNIRAKIPSLIRRWFKIIVFFNLVCFGFVFFRAQEIPRMGNMLHALFTWQGSADWSLIWPIVQFAGPLFALEALATAYSWDDPHRFNRIPWFIRLVVYSIMFYLLAIHGAAAESFVYFQF